jgi:hypothetical protein
MSGFMFGLETVDGAPANSSTFNAVVPRLRDDALRISLAAFEEYV